MAIYRCCQTPSSLKKESLKRFSKTVRPLERAGEYLVPGLGEARVEGDWVHYGLYELRPLLEEHLGGVGLHLRVRGDALLLAEAVQLGAVCGRAAVADELGRVDGRGLVGVHGGLIFGEIMKLLLNNNLKMNIIILIK